MRLLRAVASFGLVLIASGAACAERVNLFVFENADNADVTGLDLWVDVLDAGGGLVDFVFHNDSAISGFVTAVYIEGTSFSNAHLSGGAIHAESAGVDFSSGATPPNPPGSISGFGGAWQGNLFSADAESPAPTWGIHQGETLTIRFTVSGITFNQLVEGLMDPIQFRIAQHVQGLPEGASVWTTNDGETTPVPLPTAAMLAGAGVCGLALRRRRAV